MRMRKLVGFVAVAVLVGSMGWASVASALAFTLDAVVPLNDVGTGATGVIGELRPVDDGFGTTDTSGTHTDFGVVDFGTQDIFVFDLVLSAGSAVVDEIGVAVAVIPFGPPIGGGYFNDGGGLVAPSTVLVNDSFSLQVVYGFAPALAAGETTVRLFATYASGMAETYAANFMVSSGTNFPAAGTIVPEPGTGVLVGSGLLLVGMIKRRRSH